MLRAALTALLLTSGAAWAEDKYINLPGSPIEITSLQTQFLANGSSGEGPSFIFRFDIKNNVDVEVLAYSVVLIAEDAVGDLVGSENRVINLTLLPPGEARKEHWSLSGGATSKLERYGRGVAYIRAVRLEDGTIWKPAQTDVQAAVPARVD